MRVAIIGGTGFVGGYLVDALIDAGHEPSVLVRAGSESKLRQPAKVRAVSGDLASPRGIREVLEGCDAVIYNIGILREFASKGITFEKLQYRGVVRIIDAAKQVGISRFLLMSANGVKQPGTPYQVSKYRAEQELETSGLDFTIFRPSVIFGDPRGTIEFATQLYRDMVVPPVPAIGFYTGSGASKGEVLMSPVFVEDVARAFAVALEDESATGSTPESTIGRTYELGGPEVLSWTDMLERVAEAAGKRKRILPMPIGMMNIAATLLDWLPPFPVTRDQLTMLAEGNTADPAALEQLIGRAPQAFTVESLSYLLR